MQSSEGRTYIIEQKASYEAETDRIAKYDWQIELIFLGTLKIYT